MKYRQPARNTQNKLPSNNDSQWWHLLNKLPTKKKKKKKNKERKKEKGLTLNSCPLNVHQSCLSVLQPRKVKLPELKQPQHLTSSNV
jgi:P pilus assembly chaperone PapD